MTAKCACGKAGTVVCNTVAGIRYVCGHACMAKLVGDVSIQQALDKLKRKWRKSKEEE